MPRRGRREIHQFLSPPPPAISATGRYQVFLETTVVKIAYTQPLTYVWYHNRLEQIYRRRSLHMLKFHKYPSLNHYNIAPRYVYSLCVYTLNRVRWTGRGWVGRWSAAVRSPWSDSGRQSAWAWARPAGPTAATPAAGPAVSETRPASDAVRWAAGLRWPTRWPLYPVTTHHIGCRKTNRAVVRKRLPAEI